MLWHLLLCEDELGNRVGEGLGIKASDVQDLGPLPKQVLADEDEERVRNLGNNGPRDTTGLTMTHCVPNERMVVTR
jgi:catalase